MDKFLKIESGAVINVKYLIMFDEKQYFIIGQQEPQKWKICDYINAMVKLKIT